MPWCQFSRHTVILNDSFSFDKKSVITVCSCGKVMFSQASVILSTGWGHVWQGGVCVAGGHAWQGACVAEGGMHGGRACVVEVCMAGDMHGRGGVHGKGGMHGSGGHVWQWGGGANIRFCQNFPITVWNWKNLDPRGGGRVQNFTM